MRGFLLGLAAAGLVAGVGAAQSPDVKLGVDAWSKGDYRTAVEKWRPLAIASDADAQFNLAQAYKLGRGVPEDPALAESWFRRAALQGHEQAGDNYGLALFQAGRRADALPWLEKSAARGEPRAQLVLGTMLFNGDGVKRDVPRAYALMTRASAANLQSASQTLAQMDQHITPAERQRGLELARQYEGQARLASAGDPSRTAVRAGEAPAVASVAPAATPTPRATATPRATVARPAPKASPKVVASRPTPTPTATPTPAATPTPRASAVRPKPAATTASRTATPAPVRAAAGGRYRVQLGAFRDAANARELGVRVGGRVGGNVSYERAGNVTRVQAGPYRTRAEAQRACRAAGVSCVVIAS